MPVNVTVTCTPADTTLQGMRDLCADLTHLDVNTDTPITMTEPLTVVTETGDTTLNGGAIPIGAILDFIDSLHNENADTHVQGAETLTVRIPVHAVEFSDCGDHVPDDNLQLPGGLYVTTAITCVIEHSELIATVRLPDRP